MLRGVFKRSPSINKDGGAAGGKPGAASAESLTQDERSRSLQVREEKGIDRRGEGEKSAHLAVCMVMLHMVRMCRARCARVRARVCARGCVREYQNTHVLISCMFTPPPALFLRSLPLFPDCDQLDGEEQDAQDWRAHALQPTEHAGNYTCDNSWLHQISNR